MNTLPKLVTQIYLINYEKSNDNVQDVLVADGDRCAGRLMRRQKRRTWSRLQLLYAYPVSSGAGAVGQCRVRRHAGRRASERDIQNGLTNEERHDTV